MKDEKTDRATLYTLGFLGLLAGLCYYSSEFLHICGQELTIYRSLVFLFFAGIAFALPSRSIKSLIIATAIVTLIFGLAKFSDSNNPFNQLFQIQLLDWLSLFAAICLLRYLFIENTHIASPMELYIHSWDCAIILIIASLFTLLCELLINGIAYLFKAVGFPFVQTIVTSDAFLSISAATLLGIGIGACQNRKMLKGLRHLVYTLSYIVLPVLSLVSLLLLLALIVNNHQYPIDSSYYNIVIIAGIFFLNAVWKGGEKSPYRPWMQRLVNLFIVVLFIFSAYAFYKPITSTLHFGLKPLVLRDIVIAGLMFLYTTVYLIVWLISRKKWMAKLNQANIALAIITIATSLILMLPGLDLNKFCVTNQIERLKSGKPISGNTSDTSAYLENANLSHLNLSGINLSNADLTNANLSYANLNRAILQNAKIANTNFSYANLSNVDLSDTWLIKTNFTGANLTNTILPNYLGALDSTDVSDTQLKEACAKHPVLINNKQVIKTCGEAPQ